MPVLYSVAPAFFFFFFLNIILLGFCHLQDFSVMEHILSLAFPPLCHFPHQKNNYGQ